MKINAVRWITIGLFCGLLVSVKAQSISDCITQESDSLLRIQKIDSLHLVIGKHSITSLDTTLLLLDELIIGLDSTQYLVEYARSISLKAWFVNFKTQYEESLILGHEALAIHLRTHDTIGIAMAYNRIGIVNIYFEQNTEALAYLEKALYYFKILKDTIRTDDVINNLGVLQSSIGNNEEAISLYKQSMQLRLKSKRMFWVGYARYNIGEAFVSLENLDSAEYYFNWAVQTFKTKTESSKVPAMVYLGNANLQNQLQNFEAAQELGELALSISRDKQNTEMEFSALQTLLDSYEGLGDFEKAFVIQKEYLAINQKADSLNNASNITEIEEKYQNAEKSKEISELKTQSLEHEYKLQQLELLALYLALGGLIIISVLVFVYFKKHQKQMLLKEQASRDLVTIKLTALQAQMNPHFVFNCINTAQSFILDGDKEEGYMYLENFSKLLRMVLVNSNKPFFPLEDELEQLRLYIELESIRFNQKFTYEIEVDPALEQGVFEIPGMIIQSFVENSILHGLMNLKDGNGKLTVRFTLKDQLLFCEIIDNGIGRKAAQVLKEQKEVHYTSVALPNVEERLRLMHKLTGEDLHFEIVDLMKNNNSVGTHVKLMLPVQ